MVSLNGFSVKVPQCLEETSDGYAVMQHEQQYSLNLSNHHKDGGQSKPSDADVFIDGKFCGCFRIPVGQSISLERSAIDSGKFTAFRRGSSEARLTEIDSNSPEMGLIKVVFKPGTKKAKIASVTPLADSWPWPRVSNPNPPWVPAPGVYAYAVTNWESADSFSNNSDFLNSSNSTSYSNIRGASYSYTTSDDSLIGGGTGLTGKSNQEFDEVDELNYDENSATLFLRLAFRDEPGPLDDIVARSKKVYSTKVPRPLR